MKIILNSCLCDYFNIFCINRCLQTNGTQGCPRCRRSSMKPGFVWGGCNVLLRTKWHIDMAPFESKTELFSTRRHKNRTNGVCSIPPCSVHLGFISRLNTHGKSCKGELQPQKCTVRAMRLWRALDICVRPCGLAGGNNSYKKNQKKI